MHQKYMSKRLSIFVLFFYTEKTRTDDRRNMRILKEQVRFFPWMLFKVWGVGNELREKV
jgi:hypothetical protein